ncbi:MAG: hypothetical protein ABI311_13805 [Gemmatimonadaceae bacterium]
MADTVDVAEMMKRAVQANAKFYKGWMDLTLEYVRGLTSILNGEEGAPQSVAEMDTSAGALVMEGEEGSRVTGSFLVTNDLGRTVACEFVASVFNDPEGARITLKPVFTPARLSLESGEQRVVQVTVPIEKALAAGVGYAGEFSIKGMDGFAVPVVVRRLHVVGQPAGDAGVTQAEKTDGASGRRGKVKTAPTKSSNSAGKRAGKRAGNRAPKTSGGATV